MDVEQEPGPAGRRRSQGGNAAPSASGAWPDDFGPMRLGVRGKDCRERWGSTVVFTRLIDGVPVVGGEVLPVDRIRERGAGVLAFDPNAKDVKVTRFECGLFDPGVRKRDAAALVQSACFVQAERRAIVDEKLNQLDPESGHLVTAFAQAIPAGALIERDDRWPEAAALLRSTLPVEPAPSDGPGPR